jgi:hypothetical protein
MLLIFFLSWAPCSLYHIAVIFNTEIQQSTEINFFFLCFNTSVIFQLRRLETERKQAMKTNKQDVIVLYMDE